MSDDKKEEALHPAFKIPEAEVSEAAVTDEDLKRFGLMEPDVADIEEIMLAKPGELVPVKGEPKNLPATPAPAANDPFALIAKAMDSGLGPETIEKFMALQERHEANEARKAYADSMAACQKEMQPIVAASEGEKTNSYYAKLGIINQQITPIYTGHGFSLSFGHGSPAVEGEIRTTCRVLHQKGHFEDFFIDLPPDAAGAQGTVNKTPIHARASSNSYGKRYIVMGIFNLSILSEDDDATLAGGMGSGMIEPEQAAELQTMIDEAKLMNKALLKEAGVTEWPLLQAKKFEKTKARIQKLAEARK